MRKGGYVYMVCSPDKTALYTGVTSNLRRRLEEHRQKLCTGSFSAKYRCSQLVYCQFFDSIVAAIEEEKRIKGLSRMKKERMINELNREWVDLSDDLQLA